MNTPPSSPPPSPQPPRASTSSSSSPPLSLEFLTSSELTSPQTPRPTSVPPHSLPSTSSSSPQALRPTPVALSCEVMDYITSLGGLQTLPPFTSVTKLPVGQLYTVTDVVRRVAGVDGAPYTGVQLYLDHEIRTALPQRISEYLLKNEEVYQIFKKATVLFRFDGTKPTPKGNMALVSFPTVTRRNGCICVDMCPTCVCSLSLNPRTTCACYTLHKINNVGNFQNAVQGLLGEDLTEHFKKFTIGK